MNAPAGPSIDGTTANAEDLNALGLSLASRGDVAAAADAFLRAVRLTPTCVQARHNLAIALRQLGRTREAIDHLCFAIRTNPTYFEAHRNLAAMLASEGQTGLAIESFRSAVRLRPDSAEALSGLGLALTTSGRGAEATIYLRQAIRLNPTFIGAINNLGLALADAGRYFECEATYDRALQLDPTYAEAHTNLGNAMKEQGRLDEAVACYDLALSLRPGHASTRWNRSLALLQRGDFAEGWADYESRWERAEGSQRQPRFDRPRWDGSPLAGRSVLIWAEQGLGDLVQFARYGMLVREAGAGRVILSCPSPLCQILRTCPHVDDVVPEGRSPGAFDVHVPAMSLPKLFGTRLDTVPARVPYLFPEPARVAAWRDELSRFGGLKVGIAWQGNPHHRWDRHRSVPLAAFAPLGRLPGVRLISFQRGPGVEQIRSTPEVPVLGLLDPNAPEDQAVADLAALAAAVDLVITVDTLPAHLAGAIGADVWVALSTLVDWRWMLLRQDSPWYPTMRLFRQERRGEWTPVFEQMAQALRERLAACATSHRASSALHGAPRTSADAPAAGHPSVPLLSLCMIVRDAARTLPACLEGIRPWVDEMVVVDTGSADETAALAAQMGARVLHFPWIDDFAAARNESLRHARGQWVFWMDADDVIDAENGRRLRELASRPAPANLLGYVVQVHCPGQGTDVTVVDHVKLFRNRPDLQFEGRIHEQVLPAIRRADGDVGWSDVFVVHANADRTPEGRRRKLDRDLRLLRLDVAERPGHSFVLFNLGMTLADAGRHAEAVDVLAESVRVGNPQESHLRKAYALHAASLGALGRDAESLEICRLGLIHYPDDAELNFRGGLASHRLGQAGRAVEFYEQALRPPSSRAFASVDRGIGGYKARYNMAAALLDLGRRDEAERAYREVVREAPDWPPGREALAELLT